MYIVLCQCWNNHYIELHVGKIGDTPEEAKQRAISTLYKFKAGYIIHGKQIIATKALSHITARRLYYERTKVRVD